MREVKYLEWDTARKAAERERTKYLVHLANKAAEKFKEKMTARIYSDLS